MKTYKTFEDWFSEIENYGTRQERFLDEFYKADHKRIEQWLRAAWSCARMDEIKDNFDSQCG